MDSTFAYSLYSQAHGTMDFEVTLYNMAQGEITMIEMLGVEEVNHFFKYYDIPVEADNEIVPVTPFQAGIITELLRGAISL